MKQFWIDHKDFLLFIFVGMFLAGFMLGIAL